MRCNRWRFSKPIIAVGVFGLAVGLLAGLTALISGKPETGPGMGVVDDWTHHHLIFSNPGTAPDALGQGRIEQWYRIVNDPRYNMQQMKRNPMQRAMGHSAGFCHARGPIARANLASAAHPEAPGANPETDSEAGLEHELGRRRGDPNRGLLRHDHRQLDPDRHHHQHQPVKYADPDDVRHDGHADLFRGAERR